MCGNGVFDHEKKQTDIGFSWFYLTTGQLYKNVSNISYLLHLFLLASDSAQYRNF